MPATAPTRTALAPPAPDNRTPMQRVLDEIAPVTFVGRISAFNGKEGRHVTKDDSADMPQGPYAALCDQTGAGWVRFNGPGQPPDRHVGLLYDDDYMMKCREELPDQDPANWEPGLDGKPRDPWIKQLFLILQHVESGELFTWIASNATSLRAVGNLLRHYNRVRKTDADYYPLVNLKVGGFQHSDQRIGWVPTPVFQIVGRMPRADAASPEKLAASAAPFNDEIPV